MLWHNDELNLYDNLPFEPDNGTDEANRNISFNRKTMRISWMVDCRETHMDITDRDYDLVRNMLGEINRALPPRKTDAADYHVCPECSGEWDVVHNRCAANCQNADRE